MEQGNNYFKFLNERNEPNNNNEPNYANEQTTGIETPEDSNLPPEPQCGNVEYKLKIVNPSKHRFEHLVTQMKWRLKEGLGEAIYEIGIEDNGKPTGVSKTDLESSFDALSQMAKSLGASTSVIMERNLENGKTIAEVLVRKIPDEMNCVEVRVAVVGNAGVGKSTLIGVLTQGNLDNGKGKARLNIFRHLHEIKSGSTSSISHEILGFTPEGESVNYSSCNFMTAEQICEKSSKLITFLDLAGQKKYINTTIQGISGYSPHYAMLVISSNAGVVGMTREHLTIATALEVPFFIVVTKTDSSDPTKTLGTLETFLKDVGVRKVPMFIKSVNDVITAGKVQWTQAVVPIFCVSNVTGVGLDLLLKYLHVLGPSISERERARLEQEPVEFHIDEMCQAGDVGPILGGILIKGVITEGTLLKIGPQEDGSFSQVTVKSIHRNKIPCRVVKAGQSAALYLENIVPLPRTGMVLLSLYTVPKICWYFQATITIIGPKVVLNVGSEVTAHISNIRQTVVIIGIFPAQFITNDQTTSVLFKFKQHPEYIKEGQRLLLREGLSKGLGKIKQIFPLESKQ